MAGHRTPVLAAGAAADQLGEALPDQDHHGQRGDAAEDGQCDRLRLNRLLYMRADDVGAVQAEGQARYWTAGDPGFPLLHRVKTLGMTRRQIRAVIAWQTTVTLLIAVAVGLPLGIAAGRLAWHGFAGSIGAVPVTEVPVPVLVAGAAALAAAGNLLTSVPAAIAARTRPAASLRSQ